MDRRDPGQANGWSMAGPDGPAGSGVFRHGGLLEVGRSDNNGL